MLFRNRKGIRRPPHFNPHQARKEGKTMTTSRAQAAPEVEVREIGNFVVTTTTGTPILMTADELLETIDMLDCFNPWQDLDDDEGRWEKIWYYADGQWREADYRGAWSFRDPLRIAIVDKQTGIPVAEGYGTDH
jgi:hypothetical protein